MGVVYLYYHYNNWEVCIRRFGHSDLPWLKGNATAKHPNKLSQLVTPQKRKAKVISGDDDLPRQDDIGKRQRKHELRVVARPEIKSIDDDNKGDGVDFYKQVKKIRAAKLANKAELYSRTLTTAPVPEETLEDGKRHISFQMEKNRGLTRPRNKQIKNPRKNYKRKYENAVKRRKGQVQSLRKPMGPYGGEMFGINDRISRSTRF